MCKILIQAFVVVNPLLSAGHHPFVLLSRTQSLCTFLYKRKHPTRLTITRTLLQLALDHRLREDSVIPYFSQGHHTSVRVTILPCRRSTLYFRFTHRVHTSFSKYNKEVSSSKGHASFEQHLMTRSESRNPAIFYGCCTLVNFSINLNNNEVW